MRGVRIAISYYWCVVAVVVTPCTITNKCTIAFTAAFLATGSSLSRSNKKLSATRNNNNKPSIIHHGHTSTTTACSSNSNVFDERRSEDDYSLYYYAESLNLTTSQVRAQKEAHQAASEALKQRIESLSSSSLAHDNDENDNGRLKHQLVCQHRYQYGKHPFVCRNCWSYLPICLCHNNYEHHRQDDDDNNSDNDVQQQQQQRSSSPKIQLPASIKQVILWTHHREWGSVTNSGSLLPLLLKDTKLLMKGLPEHDLEFQKIIAASSNNNNNNEDQVAIVLWPDNDASSSSRKMEKKTKANDQQEVSIIQHQQQRYIWQDVKEIIEQRQRQQQLEPFITLIALEGTWRTARRMASKLPSHFIRVALPPDVAFWQNDKTSSSALRHNDDDNNNNTQLDPPFPPPPPPLTTTTTTSLLAPLRKQNGGSIHNVCTSEAVAAALVGLGLPERDGQRILKLIQKKVDLTRKYQGKNKRGV